MTLFGVLFFTTAIYAVEPLPNNLISLNSPQGLILFKKDINTNTLKLLSHFTTQKTVTYCGVASVVMVLNSSDLTPPPDSQHAAYYYFNQDDFFNNETNKIILPEEVQKNGITLLKLSKIVKSYGLKNEPFFANNLDVDKFRNTLKNAILDDKFVVINFLRSKLGQNGGGHHSPIAAYDEETDRFLLLDVARYKYPAYWVKTQDLWNAINTLDGNTYRGFLVIEK